jgi:hypothetical protein
MKKALLVMWGIAILALCAGPAFAGTIDTSDQITLGPTPQTSFVFTGTTGGFSLNLAGVMGVAVGQGSLASSGHYSISQNGASITSGTSCGTGCFTLNQSAPVLFKYGSTATNGSLLTGNLELVSINQTASTKSGVFNEALVVDLTVTGGSLEGKFTGGSGVVQITLLFTSTQNLATLGLGKILDAGIHSGSVNPLLPEPGSLALLGTGLVSLGGVVRMFRLQVRG